VKASVVWRTRQSGALATSPGRWVPTVGASDNGATGQSGAPSGACSDFCARCSVSLFLCRRPLARYSRYSAGTPDSPVNYSGVALRIPEGGKFGVDLPGAPDTVWWCIGQSGAPNHGSLRLSFALFIRTLSWTFYWFVLNLWHL
jgi:hypothetical protein